MQIVALAQLRSRHKNRGQEGPCFLSIFASVQQPLADILGVQVIIEPMGGAFAHVAWQPITGPSAKVPGLHYAFGLNGEGFAISPGVGETMGELIATGHPSIPREPYAVGRSGAQRAESAKAA